MDSDSLIKMLLGLAKEAISRVNIISVIGENSKIYIFDYEDYRFIEIWKGENILFKKT